VLALSVAVSRALSPHAVSALALDPFLSPSPESLDAPTAISMTNDSFGPGPVVEWDDLDSFGLRFGMPRGRVRLVAAISGLTDRTDSADLASRLDEISLGAMLSVFPKSPVWLSVGAGLDATGNFGGLLIQRGFHSGTDVGRPVPTVYSGGLSIAPLASFKLLFSSDSQFSPYLATAGRVTFPSRGSLIAVAGLRYTRPGVLLAMGAGWRAAGGTAPATIMAVQRVEDGPYIGFEMRVGLFALAFEDNPSLGKSNGSLGIVLGPRPLSEASAPLSLDLGLVVGASVAQRARLAVLLNGGRRELHEEAFFSFSQGYFTSETQEATATMFSEYSFGGAIRLPVADGAAGLEMGAGPFVSFEQLSTDALAYAATLGQRCSLGVTAEAGVSVSLPFAGLPLGIGWRIEWRALQADLMRSGTPFPARGSFDFEVFAFTRD
jgi:hypothetical protein